jgi:hypothetical protein
MPEQAESDAHTGGHGTRAVIAALLANLGIAVAKFVGFALTGASSMLAEAFHSVADSGNQAMLLVGGRLARRGPDPEHQFGHGSVRYFAAFLVAGWPARSPAARPGWRAQQASMGDGPRIVEGDIDLVQHDVGGSNRKGASGSRSMAGFATAMLPAQEALFILPPASSDHPNRWNQAETGRSP